MKSFLSLFLVCISLLLAPLSHAAELAPDALLQKITDDVLEIVKNDKDLKNGDLRKAVELVETRVLPSFNFNRMTQLAVGKGWRQATPEQQSALADEFRKLLVRTYSKALTQYKNQTVVVKPLVMQAGQSDVRVKSEIQQAGAKPIAIDYYLEKIEGTWRVYDLEVGGVSLVTNYRETFASEIRSNGVDGLISSLREKNRSGTSPASAAKS
jgi:phospholipid transport system substrate-binding protein